MSAYADFLERKTQLDGATGAEPVWLPDWLRPFQGFLTGWSIRQGRAALLEDCGLGKGPQALVWAENVRRITGRPVLILTPLAVTYQMEREAEKFGVDAAISRDGRIAAGVTITNYDRLHYFDRNDFGGVVGDESSCIKSYDGERRALITDFLRKLPFRLLCTATAAPNDYVELGTSSEALGYLGYMDMLARFFTNRQSTAANGGGRFFGQASEWRFKGHAEEPFWRWVSSWARALRRPSDLGYDDAGYVLPPLEHRQHIVRAERPAEGRLFDLPAVGLREERDELRRTLTERCETAAALLADADPGIAWCHLNAEGDLLTHLIPGAVQVSGSDSIDAKEEKLAAFGRGEIRVLVSKPVVAGWGLNWQHCHRLTYFPSHSFEQYYQSVRRCWRFGQQHAVTVDVVTTEGGAGALKNLERKAAQADRMFDALVLHMRDALSVDRSPSFAQKAQVPQWLAS